jgi:phosphoglycolate phosphatase
MNFNEQVSKRAIIWDWNGTLLNDVELCMRCMNTMLTDRGLPLLDIRRYREIFTFPVKAYYEKAGFDFSREAFEKPAVEFIEKYQEGLPGAPLFKGAIPVLQEMENRGFYQTILSAMEHDSLLDSLKDKDVFRFFNLVNGIGDHYAHSKLEVGQELLEKMHNFSKDQIILIGDSLHDLEVADSLKLDVILVADGHQSKARLTAKTPNVIDSLEELPGLLN